MEVPCVQCNKPSCHFIPTFSTNIMAGNFFYKILSFHQSILCQWPAASLNDWLLPGIMCFWLHIHNAEPKLCVYQAFNLNGSYDTQRVAEVLFTSESLVNIANRWRAFEGFQMVSVCSLRVAYWVKCYIKPAHHQFPPSFHHLTPLPQNMSSSGA